MRDDSVVVRGARLVAASAPPGTVGDIRVAGGRVETIRLEESTSPPLVGSAEVDGRGLWLLPGWIDIQVNDIDWLASGAHPAHEHAERVRKVLASQVARGVTGVVLATLAAPVDEIVAYLEGLRAVLESDCSSVDRALLGGLVEGTFMNPAFHGAHNPDWVVPPERALLERFAATGGARLVNIAPEASDDAIDVIRRATELGLVVGCGHAKPHARRVREAIDAGLRYVIHLGNGPTGSSLKGFDDGGLLEETLRNDELVATVIADGVHVHPAIVRDWIARKGPDGFVAVSDAGFALGPPDGAFEAFGIRGEKARFEGGRPYLRVRSTAEPSTANRHAADPPPLFGAAVDQAMVFESLVDWLTRDMPGVWHRRHEPLPLEEALAAASRFCSRNPARLLGLDDRGELTPGARADLVLARLRRDEDRWRCEAERVFLLGREASRPDRH